MYITSNLRQLKIKFVFFSFFAFAVKLTVCAQQHEIFGSINDNEGRPLHYVFIGDENYPNATFSDSVGNFKIMLYHDSKLKFHLEGFKDTSIHADKINPDAPITMISSVIVPVETIKISLRTMISDKGLVAPVTKINTIGSRYLLNTFVNGFFFDSSNKLIYNPFYLFNYEKLSGYLLLTTDKKNVRQVLRDQIKSFSLFDYADHRMDFEIIPAIDKDRYSQILVSGQKYKICKLIRTKFTAAEVAHTAAGDRGNENDQYIDDPVYYLLDIGKNKLEKLSLKKRSIQFVFSNEMDKVNKYLASNREDIDDEYLIKLGSFMNQ